MNKEKLPPILVYKKFLDKAVKKFKISIEEARAKYGMYTTADWEKLIADDKDSQ